jgi:hypothetical protein
LDAELLRNPVGLNVRYWEAVADVEHDWCPVHPNVLVHLTQMQARGSERQVCSFKAANHGREIDSQFFLTGCNGG